MNSNSPEMLHCLNTPGNITAAATMKDMDVSTSVLGRQTAVLKWQQEQLQLHFQQQQQQCYFNEFNVLSSLPAQEEAQAQSFPTLINGDELGLHQLLTPTIKPDPCVTNGWPEFSSSGITSKLDQSAVGYVNGSSGYDVNYAISKTNSCPPAVAAAFAAKEAVTMADAKGRESVTSEKLSATAGRESFKKRKAEMNLTPKVDAEEDNRGKKAKGCAEEGESKKSDQQQTGNKNRNNNSSSGSGDGEKGNRHNKHDREASGCTSKENSKISEVQKPDYIHVRARRGQATDSHSLAERVRREKISERMKYLQDLVPGCNKITGKAGMLDEIINYVQSLQRQVEFLSMKLAAANPRLDFNVDDLFAKEVFPACLAASFQTTGMSPDMTDHAYLQYNPVQQMGPACGAEAGISSVDMGLRRSINAPVSMPEMFLDSSCFYQSQSSLPLDAVLQNIFTMDFQQARPSSFPSQTFTGPVEAGSLKMEM
ncbi:hypothetical protein Ancab_027424 [Ancistrocladus abbreviatus]